MKYRDIDVAGSELIELIKKKAPRFFEEFLSKGVILYRGGNHLNGKPRIIRPNKSRIPHGYVFDDSFVDVVDYAFKKAGIARRYNDYPVYVISNKPAVEIYVDEIFYFIPLGDYTYSYLATMERDFNLSENSVLVRYIEELGEIVRMLEDYLDLDYIQEMIKLAIDGGDIKSKSIEAYNIIMDNYDDYGEKIYEFSNAEELYNALVDVSKRFSPESLNEHYFTNTVEPLVGNISEVVFNTKSYIALPSSYDLEEALKEYYG